MANEEHPRILLVPKRSRDYSPPPRLEQTIIPESLPKPDFDAELRNIEGLDRVTNPLDKSLAPEENLNLVTESDPLELIPMTVEQGKSLDKPSVSPEESGLSVENNIPDTVESLDEQIKKEELLLEHDKAQGLTITKQGDEQKLQDLIKRRDSLVLQEIAPDSAPLTQGPVVEQVPEPVAQTSPESEPATPIAPAPAQESVAPVTETLSTREVLVLQEEAFSARREMIAFRHGKKVAELSAENQDKYKKLRQLAKEKRQAWIIELNKLPEDQQDELKDLTKLKEVQARLAEMTPEQILTQALLKELAEKEQELKIVDLQLGKYDSVARRNVTALNIEGDTKELRARRRAILAQIAEIKEKLTGEGAVAPETETETQPETPEETPEAEDTLDEPSRLERALAESKGRIREMLRASINELSRRIDAINEKIAGMNAWSAWNRLQAKLEADRIIAQRQRLEDELNGERRGFGAKFKEKAIKACRAMGKRLKEGWGTEILSLNINEAPSESETQSIPEPQPEQAVKNHSRARYFWERVKGFATFGGYDAYQAEKFRRQTKKTAGEVSMEAEQIQKTSNLSVEDAQAEAMEFGDTTGLSAETIEEISREVTAHKEKENDAKINEIILSVISGLEERLKKYKNLSGQDVLTEDAKNKIAIELQQRLNEMRGAYIETDSKEITEMIRTTLDPKWWQHYVWAGVEFATDATILFLGYQLMTAKMAVAKASGVTAKEAAQVALKDTVWAEAKRQLISHGVANPTAGQIQEVATKFCVDSGIKVMKGGQLLWSHTASGAFTDTVLAKGMAIKISGGLKLIAGMASGA